MTQDELHALIVDHLGYPKFRATQVWHWIHSQGRTNVHDMHTIPQALRTQLDHWCKPHALEIAVEQVSKDGTVKRAYKCPDGQVIESVLMPYQDGRYTACISSQAGCAQGCVFCATGQMGFQRSLTSHEIYEQVARFAHELQQEEQDNHKHKSKHPTNNNNHHHDDPPPKLHGKSTRLSNIVFMGMGEPLANWRNVKRAIQRIQSELGIGARRITISTVGIVPNIRRLYTDPDMPKVRLAVSLHCATDEERSALMPVNARYGGLTELMTCLQDYMDHTGQRITLEWALIEGQNDDVETARNLGRLVVHQHGMRPDRIHVNVIPLNPTGGYGGSPSGRHAVNLFCDTLIHEFGISCTPRVRRGIDIDAGCGQLTSKVVVPQEPQDDSTTTTTTPRPRRPRRSTTTTTTTSDYPTATIPKRGPATPGIVETRDHNNSNNNHTSKNDSAGRPTTTAFSIHPQAVDMDSPEGEDEEYKPGSVEAQEAARLIALVQGTTIQLAPNDKKGTQKMTTKKKKKKKKTTTREST